MKTGCSVRGVDGQRERERGGKAGRGVRGESLRSKQNRFSPVTGGSSVCQDSKVLRLILPLFPASLSSSSPTVEEFTN